jgi:Peptidase family M28
MLARIVACACAAALLAGGSAALVDPAGVRAKQTLRAIAVLGPRVAGSVDALRAGRVVRSRFARLGLEPVVQRVSLPRGGFSRNLVFRTGRGPLRAIVVAHLDGVSAGPAANDNGSGVGALVEVARELRSTPGILYAALGAEEQVMTGSKLHLGSARLLRSLTAAERRSVRVALSLDMVGNGPELNVRGIEVRAEPIRQGCPRVRARDRRPRHVPARPRPV